MYHKGYVEALPVQLPEVTELVREYFKTHYNHNYICRHKKKLVENFGISSNMSIIVVDDLSKEEKIIRELRELEYIGLIEGVSDYLRNHDALENQYR